ncbi:hypothetical protein Y032_0404g838 [Ancylostoma ceylanicum]|nr:hypothetical protein Y032_0404g838 [Ancylostoma ceylanicum]
MLLVLTVLCARGKKDSLSNTSHSDAKTTTTAREVKKTTDRLLATVLNDNYFGTPLSRACPLPAFGTVVQISGPLLPKNKPAEFDVFNLARPPEPETPETDLKSLATGDYNVLANPVIQRRVFGFCEHRTQEQENKLSKSVPERKQENGAVDMRHMSHNNRHVEEYTQRSSKRLKRNELDGVVTSDPKIMNSCINANGEQNTAKPAVRGSSLPGHVGRTDALMEHHTQVEFAAPFEQRTQMELAAPLQKRTNVEFVVPFEQCTQMELAAPLQKKTNVEFAAPFEQCTQLEFAAPLQKKTNVEFAVPFEQCTQLEFAAPLQKKTNVELAVPLEQKTQFECCHRK